VNFLFDKPKLIKIVVLLIKRLLLFKDIVFHSVRGNRIFGCSFFVWFIGLWPETFWWVIRLVECGFLCWSCPT